MILRHLYCKNLPTTEEKNNNHHWILGLNLTQRDSGSRLFRFNKRSFIIRTLTDKSENILNPGYYQREILILIRLSLQIVRDTFKNRTARFGSIELNSNEIWK